MLTAWTSEKTNKILKTLDKCAWKLNNLKKVKRDNKINFIYYSIQISMLNWNYNNNNVKKILYERHVKMTEEIPVDTHWSNTSKNIECYLVLFLFMIVLWLLLLSTIEFIKHWRT